MESITKSYLMGGRHKLLCSPVSTRMNTHLDDRGRRLEGDEVGHLPRSIGEFQRRRSNDSGHVSDVTSPMSTPPTVTCPTSTNDYDDDSSLNRISVSSLKLNNSKNDGCETRVCIKKSQEIGQKMLRPRSAFQSRPRTASSFAFSHDDDIDEGLELDLEIETFHSKAADSINSCEVVDMVGDKNGRRFGSQFSKDKHEKGLSYSTQTPITCGALAESWNCKISPLISKAWPAVPLRPDVPSTKWTGPDVREARQKVLRKYGRPERVEKDDTERFPTVRSMPSTTTNGKGLINSAMLNRHKKLAPLSSAPKPDIESTEDKKLRSDNEWVSGLDRSPKKSSLLFRDVFSHDRHGDESGFEDSSSICSSRLNDYEHNRRMSMVKMWQKTHRRCCDSSPILDTR